MLYWIALKSNLKDLFIDHRTLLVLYKLYKYEQSSPQKKENSNPIQNWKQIQKKIVRPDLVDYTNVLLTLKKDKILTVLNNV